MKSQKSFGTRQVAVIFWNTFKVAVSRLELAKSRSFFGTLFFLRNREVGRDVVEVRDVSQRRLERAMSGPFMEQFPKQTSRVQLIFSIWKCEKDTCCLRNIR